MDGRFGDLAGLWERDVVAELEAKYTDKRCSAIFLRFSQDKVAMPFQAFIDAHNPERPPVRNMADLM